MEQLYYDPSSAPYSWIDDSPIDMSSENFSSDAMVTAGFTPPCVDPWSAYPQGSSPSSDQSSMSRAASTNTSYNELENMDMVRIKILYKETLSLSQLPESWSSERPIFDMRAQSPVSVFPPIAPRIDNDLLFGLHGGTEPVAPPKISAKPEPFTCSEGCAKKTFGRKFELERHIREQHRCPHEDCVDVHFSTPRGKREHERQHSETGLGYRCGTCLLSGTHPKSLTRGEKLKKHFKDTHNVGDDFEFRDFQCMRELCYVSKTFGGIFFASQRELRLHEELEHSINSLTAQRHEQQSDGKRTFISC
jgi:hypothetical protein